MVNQRGLFTKQILSNSIEEVIQREYEDEEILLKVSIPNIERNHIIGYLDSMNINYLSLFPDLFGSASFCNDKAFTDENTGPVIRDFLED